MEEKERTTRGLAKHFTYPLLHSLHTCGASVLTRRSALLLTPQKDQRLPPWRSSVSASPSCRCLLGFAFKQWLYYLHCATGMPTFLGQVGVRTHLSKLVGQEEIGKVFSFLATFDAVAPVLGEILITSLFNWSIGFFPGLPYLVAAGITFISAGLIGYVLRSIRRV
ncbi:hypothetical protein HPB51_002065 [Rhipicephalus microplus]|uniref:Uncharacterized protein n=1 Tax=Rhipicephalus microplus TaxID=6941 RepID=A0A9J6E5J2_RHIMP|nr:hypothetical protein HPB51_002065 [Rhipicephalus microplus]